MTMRKHPPPGTPYEQPDELMMEEMLAEPGTDFEIDHGELIRVRPGYRKRMDPAGLPALLDCIRHLHGCEATWIESAPVHETFNGETVWQGDVQVFEVAHPQASRVYAWSHLVGEGPRRRFYAILGAGPVKDAVSAVRVAIASGN